MKLLLLSANINQKDYHNPTSTSYSNIHKKYIVDKSMFSSDIDDFQDRRTARMYKILAPVLYPDYDFIIWTDSSFSYDIQPEELVNSQYEPGIDIYLFNHNDRKCIFDEAKIIKNLKLDYSSIVDEQMKYYILNEMPSNYGLFATGCIIWTPSSKTKKLALEWWEQLTRFSSRDQLSLSYCLWKNENQLDYKIMTNGNRNAKHDDYFHITNHKHIKQTK